MFRPRLRLAAATTTAAALALSACSSDPTTTPDQPGQPAGASDQPAATGTDVDSTHVTFVLSGGPVELAAYQTVADRFHELRPDITVDTEALAKGDDVLARLTTGFAAGSPPDLFLINFRKYGLYAAEGVLAPVQDFIDAAGPDGAIQLDDFFQAPLSAFRFDGRTQTCLPQNVSSLVTYVNTDLFAAAGVGLPTGDWDWDDFLAAANALTDEAADVHGIGTDPDFIRLAPMVWSNGGDVIDDQRDPTALTLDTPQAREALEFFASFVPSGIAPDDLDEQARSSIDRFITGQLGMFWSSRKDTPAFREAIDGFAWDVVPFPIAPGGERVTMLHSDAWCISAGTGHEQAAWDFVEYALGPQGAAVLAASGRTVPSIIEVANSPAFLDPSRPPANAQVFLDNAEIVRATPSTATWNAVENQVDDILAELYYGRITLERALERLAQIRFESS